MRISPFEKSTNLMGMINFSKIVIFSYAAHMVIALSNLKYEMLSLFFCSISLIAYVHWFIAFLLYCTP